MGPPHERGIKTVEDEPSQSQEIDLLEVPGDHCLHCCTAIMKYLSLIRPFAVGRSLPISRSIGSCLYRGLATATAAATNGTKGKRLPLAGVKVLDMSRVLAGVSYCAK